MGTRFIPGTLPSRHRSIGAGFVAASASDPLSALRDGVARDSKFLKRSLASEEFAWYEADAFKQSHEELVAAIEPALQRAKAESKLPSPPVNEPILQRRSMVTADPLFLEEAYRKVTWVNRCINIKAQNIASVPLRVMRRQKDGSQAQPDTDSDVARHLLRLLERPNAHMAGTDLMEAIVVWMNIRQCLLWMMWDDRERTTPDKAKAKPPVALYTLPAHRATLMLEGATPLYYRLNQSGLCIPAWQVIRIGYYNPVEELRCLSPLSALYQTSDTDYAIELHNANFFEQGTRFSGMISIKGGADDNKMARYENLIRQQSGVGNSFSTLVLDQDASWTPTSATPKDMDFAKLSDLSKDKHCSGFGVPRFMLGDPEHSNKASADISRRSFWQDTNLPEMRKFVNALNVHLVPSFNDPDIFLEHDLSQVEALADDRAEFSQSFFQTAQGLSYLNQVIPLTPEDMMDLLQSKFGIEINGQEPDDAYEEEEEIMEESARIPAVRQLKNITLQYLRLPEMTRKQKSLKLICLSYLLSSKRTRKPSAELAESLADKIAGAVKTMDGDRDKVAKYFDSLEKAARK